MDAFNKIMLAIFLPVGMLMVYVMFVWTPVHLMHEEDCLALGYPKTNTTITLKGYCTNIDGVVTKKVVPL